MDGARMVIDFAFGTIRPVASSARGDPQRPRQRRAAGRSARCRKASCASRSSRNGECIDQALWTILDEDWKAQRAIWGVSVH